MIGQIITETFFQRILYKLMGRFNMSNSIFLLRHKNGYLKCYCQLFLFQKFLYSFCDTYNNISFQKEYKNTKIKTGNKTRTLLFLKQEKTVHIKNISLHLILKLSTFRFNMSSVILLIIHDRRFDKILFPTLYPAVFDISKKIWQLVLIILKFKSNQSFLGISLLKTLYSNRQCL